MPDLEKSPTTAVRDDLVSRLKKRAYNSSVRDNLIDGWTLGNDLLRAAERIEELERGKP